MRIVVSSSSGTTTSDYPAMNSGSKSVTLHLSRAQLKSLLALAYLGAWLRSVSGVARSCGMRERRPDCSRRLPGLLAPFHQERMKGE